MSSSVKSLPFDLIYEEMRKKIMEGFMSVNIRYPGTSEENPTILQLALKRKDLELVYYLLDNNVDVNMTSKSYEPALNLAIENYDGELVHNLIQIGADVNIKSIFEDSTYQYTSIHSAVSKEIREIMENLLENVDTEKFHLGDKGYFIAMGNANFNPYERVLDPGIDITPINNVPSPLHLAISKNKFQIVKYLIEHGADVNAICDNKTPLSIAVSHKNEKIVKFLLENRARVNIKIKPFPLVDVAVTYNDFRVLTLLLNAGADINELNYDTTPLYRAVNSNDLSMVEFLIKYGADPNIYNRSRPLLQIAVKTDHSAIINSLLNAGIDVNVVNSNGLPIVETPNINVNTMTIIKRHIVKLKAAGFPLMASNLDAVRGREFDEFYRDCCTEVEALKTTIINGTCLNCYSVLHKTHQRLAIGLKNIDEDDFPINGRLETMFPLYGKLVYYHLRQANERKIFLEKAGQFLFEVFGRKLPDTFTRELFYYFSISDLRLMTEDE